MLCKKAVMLSAQKGGGTVKGGKQKGGKKRKRRLIGYTQHGREGRGTGGRGGNKIF